MAPPLTSLCNALHIRLAKVGFVDATGHVGRVLHEVLVVVTTQDLVNAHKVELHRHVVGFIAAERCVCVRVQAGETEEPQGGDGLESQQHNSLVKVVRVHFGVHGKHILPLLAHDATNGDALCNQFELTQV